MPLSTGYVTNDELKEQCEPERRLWMAFLITGLRDLTNPVYCYGDNERKEFREKYRNMIKAEAKRWLLSDDNTFGSFIWACEIFDLDPAIVRAECQKGTTGNIRLINYVKSKALVR